MGVSSAGARQLGVAIRERGPGRPPSVHAEVWALPRGLHTLRPSDEHPVPLTSLFTPSLILGVAGLDGAVCPWRAVVRVCAWGRGGGCVRGSGWH